MNTTDDNTGESTAPSHAEQGTAEWTDAVRLQRWATPDHADFYAMAGEIVTTLYALDDLTRVLRRQVIGYGQGRQLYDDTREVDPADRLVEAAVELGRLTEYVQAAQAPANRFWSAVGHIGAEVTP